MNRHDPDMDPGGVEFQCVGVEGQGLQEAGLVLLGQRFPAPKPVRDVRGMKTADAGPIENRSVGQIDQYSRESGKRKRCQAVFFS